LVCSVYFSAVNSNFRKTVVMSVQNPLLEDKALGERNRTANQV